MIQSSENSSRRKRFKKVAQLFGFLLTTGLVGTLIFTDAGSGAIQRLSNFPKHLILLYAVLAVASLLLRALRYELLLSAALGSTASGEYHCPSRSNLIVLTGVRNMFVDLLPARLGELSFFYVLERSGVSIIRAASTFGLTFFLDIIVLFFILMLFFLAKASGMVLPADNANPEFSSGILPAVSALIFLGLLTALFMLPRIVRVVTTLIKILETRYQLKTFHWILDLLEKVEKDLKPLLAPRILCSAVLFTVLVRGLKYVSLYFLFLGAVGPDASAISPLAITASFILAEAVASLPASGVMGFGSYEAVLSLALIASGVALSRTDVLGASFIIHSITQIGGYALGLLCLAFVPGLRPVHPRMKGAESQSGVD